MTPTLFDSPLMRAIGLFGIALGLFYYIQLWQLGADGLSVVSHTTPYWDFNNLWSGGTFARQGHGDWLFDLAQYREQMRALLGQNIPDQEWSYPPSILLFGAPLSLFPILPAYILWTGGSLLLLHFALRSYKLSLLVHMAILISPAVFINGLLGQNGALIAALMLAGLRHIEARPVFAGVCFGLMTIKPQYGLLLPIVLLAGGHWKVIFYTVATSLMMILVTGVWFGFEIWANFVIYTRPLMTAIMEAPYPQSFHTNAIPVFVFARYLGAEVNIAYAVQAIASLVAVGLVWWLWRKQSVYDPHIRIALTLVLAIFATPYAYTYDMVIVYAGMGLFFAKITIGKDWVIPLGLILGLSWLFALYSHILVALYQINIGGFVLAVILMGMLINLRPGSPENKTR